MQSVEMVMKASFAVNVHITLTIRHMREYRATSVQSASLSGDKWSFSRFSCFYWDLSGHAIFYSKITFKFIDLYLAIYFKIQKEINPRLS